jgi:2,4-dienoyl-CoA reductase-like NADH-dependent reductase (Old Yellow Enzyme family)
MEATDPIFQPLRFRNLELPNRVLRSNIAGRLDHYDGSGTQARINWELKFARNGVGAILSSWTGVEARGRVLPNFATIESDSRVEFWRELGRQVHEHGCAYIVQLAHAGRQRDIGGFEFAEGLSSTSKSDPVHGFPCRSMTLAEIREVTEAFARGASRVRQAGLDGIEIHGSNGYLFTQFLSAAINDRDDDYGGPLENRARLLLEVVRAVRQEVGEDFHLQVKISATERYNAFIPWVGRGNTIEDSVQVARWLADAGVDAIHVSTGASFPHPDNPAGGFPRREATDSYDAMLSSGRKTLANYLGFRTWPVDRILQRRWERPADEIEGRNLPDARAISAAVSVPVLCTGGFQTASVVREAISSGGCDGVTIARPLVANNDLVRLWAEGHDSPPNPCTYCNKCLFNAVENPIGCYEESRYSSRAEMIDQVMSVFDPPSFAG